MSLSLYKPLGDNDEATRISAAKQLSSELAALLAGERDDKSKTNVEYALKRLTRGLASGRDFARPGFALVLTEFLTALQLGDNAAKWDISLSDLIAAVVKNTTSQGYTSGQEERDYWLGRLFGLQSLVQSNILFTDYETLEKYPEVLDLLFEVAQKKPWLMESSAWTIASSVLRWPAATASKAAEITYKRLAESGMAKTGEGVGIWLALQAHQPSATPPKDVWNKGSPLITPNLATLAKVLKESGSKDADGTKPKGSWSPKLGFVWDSVLNIYFSSDEAWKSICEGKHTVAEWAEFWRVVVDESLFSSSSSEERKFWGFLFFLKSLDRVSTPQDLSTMFSKNFMRCMINQLSDAERYLNKAAAKVSRALIVKAESTAWTVPVIFRLLATNNGTPNFDQLTKTKTVDKILCSADESGLVEVVKELGGIISNPLASSPDVKDSTKLVEVRRQWAADQILSIIRNGKIIKAESWLRKVVEIFTTFGYFDIVDNNKKPVDPISTTSQGMFRARLMSCLTHLISLKDVKEDEGQSETWPYMAIKTITELEEKKNSYKFAVEFDEEISEALEKATKTIEKLRKKRASSPTDIQLLSFELLYSLIILQVYNGESDALGVLEDLQSVQKKILKTNDKNSKKKAATEEGEIDMDPSEVLVDILLSFLSKPSILLKRLAQTVFTSFCDSITRAGLERCFEVLETKEGLDGQSQLFDNEDDEEEDDEIIDENDLDSDVEMLEGSDLDASDSDSNIEILSASDSDSNIEILSASDSDSDPDTLDQNEEARKLETALQTVLSAPAGSDSDSDLPMDDEAMLKLDAQLSNIFSKRKAAANKKSQKKQAKELIVTFKSKILELLEIFVKTSPSSPLSLEILLPCLTLAQSTRDHKLQEKALNTVRTFVHNSKREGLPRVEDVDRVWELLTFVHEEAEKGGAKARRAACSSASILLVKTLVAGDVERLERVAEVYAATMVRWVRDLKVGVDNSFFTDFVGWAGSVRGKLREKEEVEVEAKAEVEVGKKRKGKKGGRGSVVRGLIMKKRKRRLLR
ncbi:DNA polymerase phi-domain-containing protein [Trichophaea hybrida]|nr:DNA polymerase phi-domain-containing protein [Trichophaea hybrida]